IVRPGREDSESAEKQENTGIGPASACPGSGAARNGVERCTADPGSPQIGTVPGLQRTTSCCAGPGTRAKHQPGAVRNGRRGNFIVVGLLFTMAGATPTCRAGEGLCGTIGRPHRSSSHMSPSVVIMCFGFEAPCQLARPI